MDSENFSNESSEQTHSEVAVVKPTKYYAAIGITSAVAVILLIYAIYKTNAYASLQIADASALASLKSADASALATLKASDASALAAMTPLQDKMVGTWTVGTEYINIAKANGIYTVYPHMVDDNTLQLDVTQTGLEYNTLKTLTVDTGYMLANPMIMLFDYNANNTITVTYNVYTPNIIAPTTNYNSGTISSIQVPFVKNYIMNNQGSFVLTPASPMTNAQIDVSRKL